MLTFLICVICGHAPAGLNSASVTARIVSSKTTSTGMPMRPRRSDSRRGSARAEPPRLVAFPAGLCQGPAMHVEHRANQDDIDTTLLECFLALSLTERILSAANYANAVARLRRLRPADPPDRAA